MEVQNPHGCQEALDEVQKKIILPLRQLQVKSFFVYAHSPYWVDFEEVDRDDDRHAKKLEALVMGDDYDSNAHGKARRQQSRWYEIRWDL
jgi:hypothetical protein